jgi:multiple sugar transport system permease protein
MTPRRIVVRVAAGISLLVLVGFAGFPLYWMLNTALSPDDELFGGKQSPWAHFERLPKLFSILGDVPIFHWLANSAFIAFGTTLLSLCMAVLAAYALSRFRFHGKGAVGFLLFATQMLPEALLVVPFFALFSALGLLNNLGGLVLADTAFTMPVSVWILKGAMDQVPFEIEESARVDGCSRFGILSLIIFPLILPSLAAAAVINFFDGWNEFLFANTFMADRSSWPASVGLASFVGQYVTPLNSVMTASILFTLPAIIFFLFAQRRIVSGLTAGSVKG